MDTSIPISDLCAGYRLHARVEVRLLLNQQLRSAPVCVHIQYHATSTLQYRLQVDMVMLSMFMPRACGCCAVCNSVLCARRAGRQAVTGMQVGDHLSAEYGLKS